MFGIHILDRYTNNPEKCGIYGDLSGSFANGRGVPEMGVPQIIHFRLGVSIIKHPAIGVPPF